MPSAERIRIYDTTLRDGTQREGISLSAEDKVRLALRLDEFGIDFIEGGWPGSNPKDVEFFQRAKDIDWKHASIASFGSTRRAGTAVEADPNILALLDAETPICTLVGKTWDLHVREVLRTTLEENLAMIADSTAYLKSQGRRVFYDAEHFFDGYYGDPEYSLKTLTAARDAGAEVLVLCDTNGGTMPWEISRIVAEVYAALQHPLGIHAHNDSETAVANSLAAVQGGVTQVQGTINGYGERCGNANLCAIIPDLELKLGAKCLPEGKLAELTDVARLFSEVANLAPDEHMPFVGKSAFAHKGGIHVAAMRRTPLSYQHIDPELVGNKMRTVISELSGKGNLETMIEESGILQDADTDLRTVLNQIKTLEARGFSFEAAEASVIMMIKRQSPDYLPPFELIDYSVSVQNREGRGTFAEATVKVKIGEKTMHTAAEGNGPVNALDAALRKALAPLYPGLKKFRLADYKVRILDGTNGTAATTRVLIDTRNGHHRWSTVGASANIIEASWLALADSVEYGIMRTCQKQP